MHFILSWATELRRFITVKRQKSSNSSKTVRKTDINKTPVDSRATNGFVAQNISYSGKFLLAGRYGKMNMSLEGTFYWEIGNSGCLKAFGV